MLAWLFAVFPAMRLAPPVGAGSRTPTLRMQMRVGPYEDRYNMPGPAGSVARMTTSDPNMRGLMWNDYATPYSSRSYGNNYDYRAPYLSRRGTWGSNRRGYDNRLDGRSRSRNDMMYNSYGMNQYNDRMGDLGDSYMSRDRQNGNYPYSSSSRPMGAYRNTNYRSQWGYNYDPYSRRQGQGMVYSTNRERYQNPGRFPYRDTYSASDRARSRGQIGYEGSGYDRYEGSYSTRGRTYGGKRYSQGRALGAYRDSNYVMNRNQYAENYDTMPTYGYQGGRPYGYDNLNSYSSGGRAMGAYRDSNYARMRHQWTDNHE